jgi:glucose-6-phosphate isomerase
VTLTVERVDARSLGALIALFERAVGLYAALVNVNAYHQPGVEAGKRAAAEVLVLQAKLLAELRANPGRAYRVEELAGAVGTADCETVFFLLRRLARNPGRGVEAVGEGGPGGWDASYRAR